MITKLNGARWILVALLILAISILSTPFQSSAPAFAEESAVGPEVGHHLLDFTLPQVDGDDINLYEQIEQYDVILIYFFYAAT